jgi:hypothetical protein
VRSIAAIVILAACASACGDAGPGQSTDTASPIEPSVSNSAAPTQSAQGSIAPTPSGTPTEYATSEFQPAFAVEVPAGWIVSERAAEVAQIYQECAGCPHGGEENGEITFDMTSANMSLEDAIADLQTAANLEAGDVVPVELGELSGLMFTGTRTESADVSFLTSGYRSEPFGLPIDVYALTLGGETATVFVDPHQATGTEGEAFMEAAREILSGVRVQP